MLLRKTREGRVSDAWASQAAPPYMEVVQSRSGDERIFRFWLLTDRKKVAMLRCRFSFLCIAAGPSALRPTESTYYPDAVCSARRPRKRASTRNGLKGRGPITPRKRNAQSARSHAEPLPDLRRERSATRSGDQGPGDQTAWSPQRLHRRRWAEPLRVDMTHSVTRACCRAFVGVAYDQA